MIYKNVVKINPDYEKLEEKIDLFEVNLVMSDFEITCSCDKENSIARILLFDKKRLSKYNFGADFSLIIYKDCCNLNAHTHPKREDFFKKFNCYYVNVLLSDAIDIVNELI